MKFRNLLSWSALHKPTPRTGFSLEIINCLVSFVKYLNKIHIHSFSFLQAKLAAVLWGSVASVRRVLGIVMFFTPALGILDLLWHWHAERVPFKVSNNIVTQKPSAVEKIC